MALAYTVRVRVHGRSWILPFIWCSFKESQVHFIVITSLVAMKLRVSLTTTVFFIGQQFQVIRHHFLSPIHTAQPDATKCRVSSRRAVWIIESAAIGDSLRKSYNSLTIVIHRIYLSSNILNMFKL